MPARWTWFLSVLSVVFGFGPGASVTDGVPLLVGHGHTPRRFGILGGGAGQVAGQGGVGRAGAAHDVGAVGQPVQGEHGGGQVDPGDNRAARAAGRPATGSAPAAGTLRPHRLARS
jgi:hypothetical protein